MKNSFITRQAIYDKNLSVYAYQLLSHNNASVDEQNTNIETTNVILNALNDIGMPSLIGKHPAFINFAYDLLIDKKTLPSLSSQVVINISGNIQITEELISIVKKHAGNGNMIALSNVIDLEKFSPLVEIADVIKIDILQFDKNTLSDQVKKLQQYDVRLLAENIGTLEEHELCDELGFDYFHGSFLCLPSPTENQRAPANKLTIINLLDQLQDPNVQIEKLEELISQDLALSYRLLKYINSAAFSMQREVDSIHHAIVMLGLNTIRSLANLMLMSKFDNKPHDLLVIAIVRARMCEELASHLAPKVKDTFFTIGLFSVIDALMDDSIENIISPLPLSTMIKDALLKHEGLAGEALKCCIAFERADWENVYIENIDEMTIQNAYFNALIWSKEATFLIEEE